MIRALHSLDVARYALHGGPGGNNRAYTLASLGKEAANRPSIADVPRLALTLRSRGMCSLAWTEGNRVLGIAAARPRTGARTWEISHLYLAYGDDPVCHDLLGALTKSVAQRGGERTFIRLVREDPLIEVAGRCGFTAQSQESLYRGARRLAPASPPESIRRKTEADDFGIFLLYTACTPATARLGSGMTFGQWSEAGERSRDRARELVYTPDGGVRGWIETVRRFRGAMVRMMAHPDDESSVDSLLDCGLQHLPGSGDAFCLVSDHQTAVIRSMWRRGFEAQSEYVTLVKSMVTTARQEERKAGATIASTG